MATALVPSNQCRVRKPGIIYRWHTDTFIEELVVGTEGKTNNKLWYTDAWGGYERVLPPKVLHGKENTQRLERTNGIVRQQTGCWHRRQNKSGKAWL